jgi:hypothetical protein
VKGDQLPVSDARWQHGSQLCFATFTWLKITKLLKKNSPITKPREKNKHRFGILRILEKMFRYVGLNLKTIKFYLIKLATDFY